MNQITIYSVNGQFFIFNKDDALKLRHMRIVWQLAGLDQQGTRLPCLLSHYGAKICHDRKLAIFKKLCLKPDESISSLYGAWLIRLETMKEQEKQEFSKKRMTELSTRNLEVTSERIGIFDETNLKIPITPNIENDDSPFNGVDINWEVLNSLFDVDNDKMRVFGDLYERGFYLTSGSKFGGHIMAYQGDPVMYHATFVVKILQSSCGDVDLSRVDYNELNALQRLCHGTNKIPLFAVISKDIEQTISYFTLMKKEYIGPDRGERNFHIIDPVAKQMSDHGLKRIVSDL